MASARSQHLTIKFQLTNYVVIVLAIKNTCKDRNTVINIDDIIEQLENMKTNETLIKLWRNYQQTSPYSSGILFEDLFSSLEYITRILSEQIIAV